MAKSILTFNDGTNNYLIKFGTDTLTTDNVTKQYSFAYNESSISNGNYFLHTFIGLPKSYDITTFNSDIINATNVKISEIYFFDDMGKRTITDYSLVGKTLTINSIPTYATAVSSGSIPTVSPSGNTSISIVLEYTLGGYQILSEPTITFSYNSLPNIPLAVGKSTTFDLAKYYTSNWKPTYVDLSIAGGGYSYTTNGTKITLTNDSASDGSKTTMIPQVYLYDKEYTLGTFYTKSTTLTFRYSTISDISLAQSESTTIDLSSYYTISDSDFTVNSVRLRMNNSGCSYTKNGTKVTITNNSMNIGTSCVITPYVTIGHEEYSMQSFTCRAL